MLTYSDMVTLLLIFFIVLASTSAVNEDVLRLILASFPGLGNQPGGNTLAEGRLVELGNTIESLPSLERGRGFSNAVRAAFAVLEPELRSKKVRLTHDERGMVISLASDVFFDVSSAELQMENAREILHKLARLFSREDLASNTFRIEGHTDSLPTDPNGPWASNWELSTERSLSVLRYLSDLNVNEQQFQVMGLADTVPLFDNATAEGRAFNRRVDIVVLTEGHL